MDFLGIIPARYSSSRFPGKPLVLIDGKPMIQHVYENVSKVLSNVVVATDDERIEKAVIGFGGKVVMTGIHTSGTDRCMEAMTKYIDLFKYSPDVVINIQGDEPFIKEDHILKLKECFIDDLTQIATIIKKIKSSEELFDPNIPKVVFNKDKEAQYFSRSPIPYIRSLTDEKWINSGIHYKHIGIYAYRCDILKEITELNPSSLEILESLEQLRWLENGYSIKVAVSEYESVSVDTPEDLKNLHK